MTFTQRYENFINCDIWSTKRTDWPIPKGEVNTSWEWAFAVNDTIGTHPQCKLIPTKAPYPVKVLIKVLSVTTPSGPTGVLKPGEEIHFNFYDIDLFPLQPSAFDISPCYTQRKKLKIEFSLKGKFTNMDIIDAVDLLEREAYQMLVKMLNVHPLRIANFRILKEDKFKIKFTLLDRQPDMDSVPEIFETSLEAVFTFLCKEIFAGNVNFMIALDYDEKNKVKISADPWSFFVNEINSRPVCNEAPQFQVPRPIIKYYTSAALAGLAIGMIVLGIILGSVGLHTYSTKKIKNEEIITETPIDVPTMSPELELEESGHDNTAYNEESSA